MIWKDSMFAMFLSTLYIVAISSNRPWIASMLSNTLYKITTQLELRIFNTQYAITLYMATNSCNHPMPFMLSSTLHKISWQLGFLQSLPVCPPVRQIWPRTSGTIQCLLCSPVRCTRYRNHLRSFSPYYVSTSDMVTHSWNHSMPSISSTLYKILQPLGILQSLLC